MNDNPRLDNSDLPSVRALDAPPVLAGRSPVRPDPRPRHLGRELIISLRQSFIFATKVLLVAAAIVVGLFAIALVLLRNVDPPTSAVMLAARLAGSSVAHRWVPIEQISANLTRAVIISEDVRFCRHNGVDTRELNSALAQAKREGFDSVRGASTITMQVAKNLFLWQERTLLRKGLEIAAATAIDKVWTKRRTMEIYLNIAQWGKGIYGAEAAARYHFGKPASQLTPEEAALLAVSLPAPATRSARKPSRLMQRLARRIQLRKNQVPGAHLCVFMHRFGG